MAGGQLEANKGGGAPSGQPTVRLLGDSHALSWYEGVNMALLGRAVVDADWVWATNAFRPYLEEGDEAVDVAMARDFIDGTLTPALRPGDVIVDAGGEAVTEVSALRRAAAKFIMKKVVESFSSWQGFPTLIWLFRCRAS